MSVLPRVRTPKYLADYWRGRPPASWVKFAVPGVVRDPLVLPLTRLSGGLVFPVLSQAQLQRRTETTELDIALISVSPPKRALRELLTLRAYGPIVVLLPPTHQQAFFDLAELDVRGIGIAQANDDGTVSPVIAPGGVPQDAMLPVWWRQSREQQLMELID